MVKFEVVKKVCFVKKVLVKVEKFVVVEFVVEVSVV